ncbi:MAG: tetratricopeptide repeat protein, partial [Polymorphobacter sp.]
NNQITTEIAHLRGIALIQTGRVEEGLKQWELILQQYPHLRSTHIRMAEVLAQIGQEERAMHHLLMAEKSGKLDLLSDNLKKKLQSHLSAMR